MKIIRFNKIILALLYILVGHLAESNHDSVKNKNDMYKFSADELLLAKFPSYKFRDQKRKSRVLVEANSKLLHIFEDSIRNSESVLEHLYVSDDDLSLYNNFKFASLIPPKLLKLLVNIVNNMIENLPPYLPNTYLEDEANQVIRNYKEVFERERRYYKNVVIRVACRLVIISVLLSSYENLENREQSVLLGVTYPFLDDIIIKNKSTINSKINDILNSVIDYFKYFGDKIKSGIRKTVNLEYNDKDYDAVEMFEANTKNLLSSIKENKISPKLSLLGKDEELYDQYPEVISIMKIYIGKQARAAINIFRIIEQLLEVNTGDTPKLNETRSKMTVICRNRHLMSFLPIGMKFKSCVQMLNVVLQLYSGYHYRKVNKKGRKNISNRIRKMACIRFIQVS